MKGLAAVFDLLPRRRIDHVAVVGSDLLVQALGRMRQKAPVLVARAGGRKTAARPACVGAGQVGAR